MGLVGFKFFKCAAECENRKSILCRYVNKGQELSIFKILIHTTELDLVVVYVASTSDKIMIKEGKQKY